MNSYFFPNPTEEGSNVYLGKPKYSSSSSNSHLESHFFRLWEEFLWLSLMWIWTLSREGCFHRQTSREKAAFIENALLNAVRVLERTSKKSQIQEYFWLRDRGGVEIKDQVKRKENLHPGFKSAQIRTHRGLGGFIFKVPSQEIAHPGDRWVYLLYCLVPATQGSRLLLAILFTSCRPSAV